MDGIVIVLKNRNIEKYCAKQKQNLLIHWKLAAMSHTLSCYRLFNYYIIGLSCNRVIMQHDILSDSQACIHRLLTFSLIFIFLFDFIQVDAVDRKKREQLLVVGHGHGGLSQTCKNSHSKWWLSIRCAKWSKQHRASLSQSPVSHKSKLWRWFFMKSCRFVIFSSSSFCFPFSFLP